MTRLIITFSIVFALLFFDVYAQQLKVTLKEKFVIGDDENAPDEYLFAYPKHVNTDSKNNIYIADLNMSKIRVFNQYGQFIKSIGRKGQGPGEMQEVMCMTIDHNDDLIVVDRMSRRFTRFSKMGEEFTTYPMPDNSFIDPWIILPLGLELYALQYRVREDSKYYTNKESSLYNKKEDKLVHIYPIDFSSVLESFVSEDDIWDLSQPFFRAQIGRNSIKIATLGNNAIVIAPWIYEGLLYLYQKVADQWQLKTLRGKIPTHKSYKMLNFSDYPDLKFPRGAYLLSGQSGKFAVRMQNMSRGLFAMNNGTIVHFSVTRSSEEEIIDGVELFEPDGTYIGYGQFENHSMAMEVLWKDKDDRFYIRDSMGFSKIRVMSLEYQKIDEGK